MEETRKRIAVLRIVYGRTLDEWRGLRGSDDAWDYPVEELGYLCEKAQDDDAGSTVYWLIGDRLYEAPDRGVGNQGRE